MRGFPELSNTTGWHQADFRISFLHRNLTAGQKISPINNVARSEHYSNISFILYTYVHNAHWNQRFAEHSARPGRMKTLFSWMENQKQS
jgi:hypothetical protein